MLWFLLQAKWTWLLERLKNKMIDINYIRRLERIHLKLQKTIKIKYEDLFKDVLELFSLFKGENNSNKRILFPFLNKPGAYRISLKTNIKENKIEGFYIELSNVDIKNLLYVYDRNVHSNRYVVNSENGSYDLSQKICEKYQKMQQKQNIQDDIEALLSERLFEVLKPQFNTEKYVVVMINNNKYVCSRNYDSVDFIKINNSPFMEF